MTKFEAAALEQRARAMLEAARKLDPVERKLYEVEKGLKIKPKTVRERRRHESLKRKKDDLMLQIRLINETLRDRLATIKRDEVKLSDTLEIHEQQFIKQKPKVPRTPSRLGKKASPEMKKKMSERSKHSAEIRKIGKKLKNEPTNRQRLRDVQHKRKGDGRRRDRK